MAFDLFIFCGLLMMHANSLCNLCCGLDGETPMNNDLSLLWMDDDLFFLWMDNDLFLLRMDICNGWMMIWMWEDGPARCIGLIRGDASNRFFFGFVEPQRRRFLNRLLFLFTLMLAFMVPVGKTGT